MPASLQLKTHNAKALFDFNNQNLYGLRSYPITAGGEPDNKILVLNNSEAAEYLEQQGIRLAAPYYICYGLIAYKEPLSAAVVDSCGLVHLDKPLDAEDLLIIAKRAIKRADKLQQRFDGMKATIDTFELDVNDSQAQQQVQEAQAKLLSASDLMTTANDAQIQTEFENYVKIGGHDMTWDQMAYEANNLTEKYYYNALAGIRVIE